MAREKKISIVQLFFKGISAICFLLSASLFCYLLLMLSMFWVNPSMLLSSQQVLEIPVTFFLLIVGLCVGEIGYVAFIIENKKRFFISPFSSSLQEGGCYVITAYFFGYFFRTAYTLPLTLLFLILLPQLVMFYSHSFLFHLIGVIERAAFRIHPQPPTPEPTTHTFQEEISQSSQQQTPFLVSARQFGQRLLRIRIITTKRQLVVLAVMVILVAAGSIAFGRRVKEYLLMNVLITQRAREGFTIALIRPENTTTQYDTEIDGNHFESKKNNLFKVMTSQGELTEAIQWHQEKVTFVLPATFKTGLTEVWLERPVQDTHDIIVSNKIQMRVWPRTYFFPEPGENIFSRLLKRIKRWILLDGTPQMIMHA